MILFFFTTKLNKKMKKNHADNEGVKTRSTGYIKCIGSYTEGSGGEGVNVQVT